MPCDTVDDIAGLDVPSGSTPTDGRLREHLSAAAEHATARMTAIRRSLSSNGSRTNQQQEIETAIDLHTTTGPRLARWHPQRAYFVGGCYHASVRRQPREDNMPKPIDLALDCLAWTLSERPSCELRAARLAVRMLRRAGIHPMEYLPPGLAESYARRPRVDVAAGYLLSVHRERHRIMPYIRRR